MGRPERPINPADGAVQRFAVDLRRLRATAGGPSYRVLARRANYSRSTLSEAAAGDDLPSLAVALAYVEACGGDRQEWEARWQAVEAERARACEAADEVDVGAAPYRGLAAYRPEDAERFFGREELVNELIARLAEAPFLMVFGASGSGKSSLLRAGLIPAVRGGRLPGSRCWPVVLLTPGEHPLEELAVHLASLQGVPAGALHAELRSDPAALALAARQALVARGASSQLLLVVDQFEELFTLCRDGEERMHFVCALLAVVSGSRPPVRLVLGARADFYAHCAEYPALVAAMRDAQVLVGRMSQEQLRAVITKPASRAGLSVEPALVATALADMREGAAALPLLSHALLATWKRRRGTRLTLADYQAAGGVQGAIAQSAQAVHDGLTVGQRELMKSIFMRLAATGEGAKDTGRRVRGAELVSDRDAAALETVLQRLVAARLVTLDDGWVGVAHEALFREWPTLQEWLAADRDGLRVHRQLTEAAAAWESHHRDPDTLHRGLRLAAASEWAAAHPASLNDREREFLADSRAREQDELRAAKRRNRRLRTLVGVLATLLTLTGLTGSVALRQWQVVEHQRNMATARELAAEADAVSDGDPRQATMLSLAAFAIADTTETRSAILNQLQRVDGVERFLTGHTDRVNDVAFSPDGATFASAGADGSVIIWDSSGQSPVATLTAPTADAGVTDVAFSPQGGTLATSHADTVIIWDLARRVPLATLTGGQVGITSIVFSPDGATLASAGEDGTVIVWDVARRTAAATLDGHDDAVRGLAFSPDGATLASGSSDRTIILWNVPEQIPRAVLAGHSDGLRSLAFSPDGATLASASFGGSVVLWEVAGGVAVSTLEGHDDAIDGLAFSPDGATLATGSSDRTIILWDVSRRSPRATLIGHSDEVTGLAFAPDGIRLASTSLDALVVTWDVSRLSLAGHTDSVFDVAFGPDGRTLASVGKDSTAFVWNLEARAPQATLNGTNWMLSNVFSPDGRTVAIGGLDGNVTLWDRTRGAPPVILTTASDWVLGVTFSPDGRTLAAAGYDSTGDGDGSVGIWDAASHTSLATLRGPLDIGATDVGFSPDGRTLAVGSADGTIQLWDVARRSNRGVLARHAGVPRAVAFAPDGLLIASGNDDGSVTLWDVASQTRLATLTGHADEAYDVAFSHDGEFLASAGLDGSVILWDIARRSRIATLAGHRGAVNSVAISPDGRTLATGGDDRAVILWDPDIGSARHRLCALLGGDLAHQEWAASVDDSAYRPSCR